MQRSWMPLTAGIIAVVAGCLVVLACIVFGIIMLGMSAFMDTSWNTRMPSMMPAWLFIAVGIPLLLIALLAIIGGVFSIRSRHWGLALAGSIAALFPFWILGAAAIVFVILGKNEYK